MNTYLLIQTAFIGDAILLSAMVESIHQHDAEAKIDIVVRKGNESLYTDHPHVNKVWAWNKKAGKYKTLFQLIQQLKQNQYEFAINIQRFATTGFLTTAIKAKTKIGFKKNPFSMFWKHRIEHSMSQGAHEIERNIELLKPIFGEIKSEFPKLYPTLKQSERVKTFQSTPYYCFYPASVWFTKQLPEHKWVELLNKAPKEKQLYLVGAPAEKALCDRIIEASERKDTINLCGQLQLMESAALGKSADMNFMNDSGPLHLMSSVNAPTTAFFCSTIKGFGFYPLSKNSKVIEVQEELACRPCGLHGKKECPLGHFKCGNNIEITGNLFS